MKKNLNLTLPRLFILATVIAASSLPSRTWSEDLSDEGRKGSKQSVAPERVGPGEETTADLALAFGPGTKNPWAAKETISTADAVAAWKKNGSQVLLVARYGTSSYQDAKLESWSGKSHDAGTFPVLEGKNGYIKTVFGPIGGSADTHEVVYLRKDDLTENPSKTAYRKDHPDWEAHWTDRAFPEPLPEKLRDGPRKK
jgi:hypothetical protein